MKNFLGIFFSTEKKVARLEKDLRQAVLANNQPKLTSNFGKLFLLLLEEKQDQRLSDLVLSNASEIEDVTLLEKHIPSTDCRQAVHFLTKNNLDAAAITLCDWFGFDSEAIEILAKRGRANDLAIYINKDGYIDKEKLETVVRRWEKYNGDIRKSPALSNVLKNIAKTAPASLPNNPHVKEIFGQFKEAAVLYENKGRLSDAAWCYEQAGLYDKAYALFKEIGDNEGVSRVAKPLIKIKVKDRDFMGAISLVDETECEAAEKEEILKGVRQHFAKRLASAASEEERKSIHRDRLELEDRAGNFGEAGRIAEDDLRDVDLAISLYEKAGLIDRAIGLASGYSEEQANINMRLARLHEKGGSLLNSARLYEALGEYDRAYALYERIQMYNKAIECYVKTSNPGQAILLRLYEKAGEFEKVIEIYLRAGTFSDLEKALTVAKTHKLTSHIRVIKEKLAAFMSGNQEDLNRCFSRAKDEVRGTYAPVLGIDFGTTNSVAAIFNKKSKTVEIIPNSRGGDGPEPTYFGIDENNHPIFGEEARLRSLTDPDWVVARVKRSLGQKRSFLVNGQSYSITLERSLTIA